MSFIIVAGTFVWGDVITNYGLNTSTNSPIQKMPSITLQHVTRDWEIRRRNLHAWKNAKGWSKV